MNLILQRNPKFLRKLKALGMGTSGGAGKTGYAEFNPGTAGSQYAEGGLLSVTTHGVGHRPKDRFANLGQYAAPDAGPNRPWTTKEIEAGVRGVGHNRQFVPDFAQLQQDFLSTPEGMEALSGPAKAVVEKRVSTTGDVTVPAPGETQGETDLVMSNVRDLMASLKSEFANVKTAFADRSKVSAADTALLDALGKTGDYYKDREGRLDEQRQRAQWGNLAQFFSRLGTDVSGGAQQGGIRGLLGAAVSAGGESVPEVLATEQEFAQRSEDLQDKIFDSNIKYLTAAKGISQEEYERGTAAAIAAFEASEAATTLGIDLLEQDNERREALNALEAKDSAEIRKILQNNFSVAMTEGGVWMVGDKPMDADKRIMMNEVETIAALILRNNGGDYADVRLRIAPMVEQVLDGTYEMQYQHNPAAPAGVDDGSAATEQDRENLATGDSGSLADSI